MLQRAFTLLPDGRSGHSGSPRIALALTGGPVQTVLRPAQLEEPELCEWFEKTALFGESAVLTTRQGTEARIDQDTLVLEQPDRSVGISETGSVWLVSALREPDKIGRAHV